VEIEPACRKGWSRQGRGIGKGRGGGGRAGSNQSETGQAAQRMEKRVQGVMENMRQLYVPEIDKKIEIFGKSPKHTSSIAGDIERYDGDIINNLVETLVDLISTKGSYYRRYNNDM
jgi:hypothetical protein